MSNTLFIHKTGTNKFWHRHNNLPTTDFVISDFEISIDGSKFNIIQNNGAVRFTYDVSDISIQVLSGAIEIGFSPTTLYDRLIAIGYTPFFNVSVIGLTTDEIDAIHGAASPSASNPFATMADVGGGGGGGVLTVTGDLVDNTDPENPVIITPDMQAVLGAGGYAEDSVGANTIDISVADSGGKLNTLFDDGTTRVITINNAQQFSAARYQNSNDFALLGVRGFDGNSIVEFAQKNEATNKQTNVYIKNAIADAYIFFPAPTADGNYILATEDYVDDAIDAIPIDATPTVGSPNAVSSDAVFNAINAAVEGLSNKSDCRVATTVNITLSGTQTIDGVALSVGNRVLVKDQTTQSQNGIYVVASGAWARATDMNTDAECIGAITAIDEGTTNADTTWRQTADGVTIGSSNIVFVAYASATPDATTTTKGKAKLYTSLGTNIDGAPDQNTVNTAVGARELSTNKTGTVAGNETSTTLFPTLNGITSWIKNNLLGWVGAHGTAIVDADTVPFAKSGVLGTRTWAQIKATLASTFLVENAIVDYSATSTITTFASYTTKEIRYKVVGNLTHVWFDIAGVSNSSSQATFTLPTNHFGISFQTAAGYTVNNSAASTNVGRISLANGSNVVTINRDMSNGVWSSFGNKQVTGYFVYQNQ